MSAGDAVKFLRLMQPDGPWMLTAIKPDGGGIDTRTFTPGEVDKARQFIDGNDGHRNLYFAVNPPIKPMRKKAAREDIRQVDYLHVDIDPRVGEDIDAERQRLLGLLTDSLPAGVPPPTCIIDSGNGVQGFWRLREPIPIDGDRTAAENAALFNLQLERLFGGDNCHDISRVMRLPGTVNLPTAKKRAAGRVKTEASAILFESDRVYPIDLFQPAEGARHGAPADGAPAMASGPVQPVKTTDLNELVTYGVPDRVKIIIAQGRHPDQPKKGDDSRSAWLYDAVCQLMRCRVPDDVILGIITDPEWGISESVLELKSGAQRYALRQIEKARAEVGDPPLLYRDDPLQSAREFRNRQRPTLMHYNDDWLAYDGAAYRELEDATTRSELYQFLDKAITPGKKDEPPAPFRPNKAKVANVEDALKGLAHVQRDRYAPPCWLDGDGPPPGELLACRNGLLHLPTDELLDPTPRLFTRNALEFDYVPDPPPPARWLRLLKEFWGDGDEIGLLQEMIGYLLTPDTSQQKIFLLVGPRRSGKGTIGRVLQQLIGHHNTVGPTLGTLAKDFGLAMLVGKQLAIVSDMRLGKMSDRAAITENLLRVSGEDIITTDRKFKSAWTGQLAVRFVILTNELPSLPDDSGALASRLVPLVMHQSFLGREDPGLANALLQELPGILVWAIKGWRRLNERGHFVLPASSMEAVDDVHTLGSPVASFLGERCVFDTEATVPKDVFWLAWRRWCEEQGTPPGNTRTLGKQIIAAGHGRIRPSRPHIGPSKVPCYAGIRLVGREAQGEDPF